MADKRWTIEYEGQTLAVEPVSSWGRSTVRLLADGEELATAKGDRRLTLEVGEAEVRVWPAWHGETITRAELRPPGEGAIPLPFDPPAGSIAERLETWGRRHPALYSARHAFGGVGKVLLGLVGLSFLLRLLPDISIDLPLPEIDLPLPEIPWPSVDLPDFALPGWVRAILESAKYWGPILAGVVYATIEYRRRRRLTSRRGAPAPASDRRAG